MATQREHSPDMRVRHHTDNGNKVCVSLSGTFEHGISIRLICNSLHHTAETVKGFDIYSLSPPYITDTPVNVNT